MGNKMWFQWGVGILLTLLIIYLANKVDYIFTPFLAILKAIAIPLLIGGVLFYLTRPILHFLEKYRFQRWASILLIVILLIGGGWLFYAMIGPVISEQANAFMRNLPATRARIDDFVSYVLRHKDSLPFAIDPYIEQAKQKAGSISGKIGGWLFSFLTVLFQSVFTLILVPFFLIYLLKDHEKFIPFLSRFLRGKTRTWVLKTLRDVDEVLRSYIQGQLLVSFLVGVMLLIGFLIIGLDYAVLLAVFGMLMNVVPFLGAYLSTAPAVLIALVQDPKMAIYVVVIALIANQIESNFISPNVMGRALDVHPLTVITIILTAGSLAGFWGILLGVPAYAVLKVVVSNLYARRDSISEAATQDVDEGAIDSSSQAGLQNHKTT